ncbi:collagen alpha-2(I) chain-like isoform X2 [Pristis pectinata]|nr:collagen alpha-2(I) chain-like isoform X2 [Pristis pectinata]
MKKNVGAMTKPGVQGKQTVPSGSEPSQAGPSLRRHAQYNEVKSRSVAEVTPRSTARPKSLGTVGSTGTKARSPGTPSSGRATAPIRGEVPKEPVCQGQARRMGLHPRGQGLLGPRRQRPQEVPGSRVKGSPVLVPPGKGDVGPHGVSSSSHRRRLSPRPATSGTPTSGTPTSRTLTSGPPTSRIPISGPLTSGSPTSSIQTSSTLTSSLPTSEPPTSNSCPAKDFPSDPLTPSPLTSNSCPPKDLRPEFPTSDPMRSNPSASNSSPAKDLPSYLPTSDSYSSNTMSLKLLPSNPLTSGYSPSCPTSADDPPVGSVPMCGEVNHSPKGHEGNRGVWATGFQGPGQSRGTGWDGSHQQQPTAWQGWSGDLRVQGGAEPGVGDLAGSLGGEGGAQQAGERSPAQAGERSPAQAGERGPVQTGECSMAQAGEHGTEQRGKCSPARAGEHSTEQAGEHSTEQAGERSPAQAGEHGSVQTGECSMAQAGEHGTEQRGKCSPARAGERSPARAGERSPARAGERSPVQAGERSPVQARERSPVQAGERSTTQAGEHGPAQTEEWLSVQVTGDELGGEGARLSRGCSVQGVCDGPSSLDHGDTETTALRTASPETCSKSPGHSCSKVDCGEQGGTGEQDCEVKDLQETIFELRDQVEQHQAVQLHNNSTIRALECKVKSLERQNLELEKQLEIFNKKMKEEAEEWRYFQADLQTAVVVANDIKCEAQQEMRELRRELQEERRRTQQLQEELEAMQALRSEPSLQ